MTEKKANKTGRAETLLVELLTEELPPKALQRLSQVFCDALAAGLRQDGLLAEPYQAKAFATPRRLAVSISNVLAKAPDKPVEIQGPSLKVGLDAEGKPTQALVGFSKKNGVAVDELIQIDTPKGKVFACRKVASGTHLETNLELKVGEALKRLPVPKTMHWGDGNAQFARPVHGLVMLHGTRVVPGEVLGASSSNKTLGHRFLSGGVITLKHANDYERTLCDKGKVIVDFSSRRNEISKQLEKAAGGAKLVVEDALLDEISALVEAPTVYAGEFDAGFLAVPEECLILSMQQHQKYVPLRDETTGKLLPRFLFVSNVEAKDPREIIRGNERVLHARLADARFFYDQDRKTRLEARVPRLANVVYHNKLGSQLERVERIQLLAGKIARELGADPLLAERAAWLSKADLLTDMVGEFPELQGGMGRYYALHDSEPKAVADAIESHYRPRFAGDALPGDLVGTAVALADKLYTLVGMFAVGGAPTGEKDPFALRRQALGVLRIMMETPVSLDLFQLLRSAEEVFPSGFIKTNPNDLRNFLRDRLRNYLRERGEDALQIEAVVSQLNGLIYQTMARLNAVKEFVKLPEAKDLAAANKRVLNIIYKNDEIRHRFVTPKREIMKEPDEIALMDAVERLTPVAKKHFEAGEYEESLRLLSKIKPDVDRFFDKVMVMVEDVEIRNNRAALLQQLGLLMNQVADISKLAA